MLGRDISEALGGIAEDKIEAAAKAAGKGRNVWRSVAAVAAMVALVVAVFAMLPKVWEQEPQLGLPTFGVSGEQTLPTDQELETMPQKFFAAPGIAKLYSYTQQSVPAEELEKYEVTDAIAAKQDCWIEGTDSEFFGIKFVLSMPADYYRNAKITFRMVTEYGEFWGKHPDTNKFSPLGKEVETENPGYLCWKPGEDLELMRETLNFDALYLHVLIYADDQPVGFGIMELNCQQLAKYDLYAVALLRFQTICYPLVDGQFQAVTDAYIDKQIEENQLVMKKEYEAWREGKITEKEGDDASG